MALERKAAQLGKSIRVTLIEGKQFRGEKHYNQCVGVLSPPLPQFNGIGPGDPLSNGPLPGEYPGLRAAQLERRDQPGGDDEDSYALRRVQFDQYMLYKVMERGIEIFPGRAVDLEFHPDRVIVYTESLPLEADVVVGAFGLDEGSASMFSRHTSYKPPEAINSLVTKCHPEPSEETNLEGFIHAFLLSNPGIEFGAVTPKSTHCTINIAGDLVDTPLMDNFISHPAVQQVIPEVDRMHPNGDNDLIYFKGRFPRSLARNYYGDRYVMIGDAAGLVRALKGKGVTTAVLTGIRAAETILNHGYTREAFHQHYRTANQDIIQDLPYGRAMRVLTIFMARVGLLNPVLRARSYYSRTAVCPFRCSFSPRLVPGSFCQVAAPEDGFRHPEGHAAGL